MRLVEANQRQAVRGFGRHLRAPAMRAYGGGPPRGRTRGGESPTRCPGDCKLGRNVKEASEKPKEDGRRQNRAPPASGNEKKAETLPSICDVPDRLLP
jgi:hypothetical protein